jgi:hypothetical protein
LELLKWKRNSKIKPSKTRTAAAGGALPTRRKKTVKNKIDKYKFELKNS